MYTYYRDEQFTGLCDKNGEEIYEGDLLKTNNEPFIVKFIDVYSPMAQGITHGFFIGDECKINGDDFEVIGNIHVKESK